MPPAASTACVFCAKKRRNLEIYLYSSDSEPDEDCTLFRQTLRFLSIGLGVEFHSLETSSSLPLAFQFCKECEALLLEAQRLMSAFQELSHKIKTLIQDSMKMDKAQQNFFGGNQQNTEKCRRFRQDVCRAPVHVEVQVKEEFEWEIEPEPDELDQEKQEQDDSIQNDATNTNEPETHFGDKEDDMLCQDEDEDEQEVDDSMENDVTMTIDTESTVKVEEASDEDDHTDVEWESELGVDMSNANASELDQSDTDPEPEASRNIIARRLRSRSRTNRSSYQTPSIYVYPSRNPKKQKREETPKISDWKPIRCPICDENLDTSRKYAAHLKSHMNQSDSKNSMKCHFCSITKTSNTSAVRMRIHEVQEHSDSLLFSCGICDKKYINRDHLEAHNIIHTETKGPYKCSVCQDQKGKLKLRTKEKLEEHIILIHNHEKRSLKKTVFACEICKKICTGKTTLAEHVASHSQNVEKPYTCEVCQKKLKGYTNLIKHLLQNHHQKESEEEPPSADKLIKLFHCEKPNCDRKFKAKTLLEWHETVHEKYDCKREEWKFKCDICSMPFPTEEKLQGHHRQWHLKPLKKYINCPLKSCGCELKFQLRGHLMQHIKNSHPQLLKFRCKIFGCGEAYYSDDILKTHVKTHPDFHAPNGIFRCEVCASQFTEREKLGVHLELHTGESQRKCRQCSMTFKTIVELTKHIKRNHVDKPYKCDVGGCKYSYNCETYLLVHKKNFHPASDGSKTLMCELCSNFYATERALKRHIKWSHNTSVCEICGKTLNTWRMDEHVRNVHLKNIEKKNKCYFCGQKFLSRCNMKSHLYTHTKEKPFICSKCGKEFNQRHCLKNHACETQKQRQVTRNRRRDTDTTKATNAPAAKSSFSGGLAGPGPGSATVGLTHDIFGNNLQSQSNPSMTTFSFPCPQAQQLMDFQHQAQNQMHMLIPPGAASSGNVPFPLGNYFNSHENVNVSNVTKLNNQGQGQYHQEQTGQAQPVLEYNFYN